MVTNIRKYVDFTVTRGTRPIDTANFDTPLFLTQTNLFEANERIRSYNSIDAMIDDGWSGTSAAVRWATNVFSGTARPRTVMIGKQGFGSIELRVQPGDVEYGFTVVATGAAPQRITFTGTVLTTLSAVVAGLVAAVSANTNLTGLVTAAAVNDTIELTPANNVNVSITNLTSNLQANVNQFTVDASAPPQPEFSIAAQAIQPREVLFNADGSGMYVVDGATDTIYQYTLSTPGDVSTATYDNKSVDVSSQNTTPLSAAFNTDFSIMYVLDNVGSMVYQYTLSTPGDVSTATYDNKSVDVSSESPSARSINFNTDTSIMYTTDGRSEVDQYTLSTPGDVSTATYDNKSVDVGSVASTPSSAYFSSSGARLYLLAGATDTIYQYTLSTPGDVSTATYDNKSVDVSSETPFADALTFSGDLSRMYVTGADTIYQYTLSTPGDVSTATLGLGLGGAYTASFTLTANGTAEVISVTEDPNSPFADETAILNALALDINSKPSLTGLLTTSISGGQLLIDPAEGATVTLTNPSSTVTTGFDKFIITPQQSGSANTYSFNLRSSSVTNPFPVSYEADSTPTTAEILQGLSDEINNSGLFGSDLVAGVVGPVLRITPNPGVDTTVDSLTDNLVQETAGAESVTEALAAAAGEDDSFFFLCAEDKTPAVQLELGRYAQANDKMYITTVPSSTVASTDDDDIASQLMDAQLDNTHTTTYVDDRLSEHNEGGVIGAMAAINPGESTLAYKSMPGVSVTNFSTTQQNRIQGKNSNIYPLVNGVSVYDEGVNQSGLYFDDVRFGLWVKARVAEAVFALLKRESDLGRKVTYGNTGFEQIRAAIFDNVLNVAIRRNAILTRIDGVEDPVVRIPDVSEIPDNDRANRILPDVVVEFTYSGAIHKVRGRVFILL